MCRLVPGSPCGIDWGAANSMQSRLPVSRPTPRSGARCSRFLGGRLRLLAKLERTVSDRGRGAGWRSAASFAAHRPARRSTGVSALPAIGLEADGPPYGQGSFATVWSLIRPRIAVAGPPVPAGAIWSKPEDRRTMELTPAREGQSSSISPPRWLLAERRKGADGPQAQLSRSDCAHHAAVDGRARAMAVRPPTS